MFIVAKLPRNARRVIYALGITMMILCATPRAIAFDPITGFIGGYLGGKVLDGIVDPLTGKPNVYVLDQRLRELETNAFLRADVQNQIRGLRSKVDQSVTRDEFLRMAKQVAQEAAEINRRLDAVEERVELLEVQLDDSKTGAKNESSSNHFTDRATAFFRNRDFHRSIANCNIAIRLDPSNSVAHFRRAQSFRNLNAPADLLLIDYDEALRLDAKYADAYYCRASIRRTTKDLDGAMSDINQAIHLNPNNDAYLAERALTWFDRNDHQAAIADCDAAIRINPNNPDYLAQRAFEHANVRQLDLAVRDAEAAIAINEDCLNGHLARCFIYLLNKNADAAIFEADKCLRIDPKCALAYANRGCAYCWKENWKQAESDLAEAVRLNPHDNVARQNLEIARNKLAPQAPGDGETLLDGTWTFTLVNNGAKVAGGASWNATLRDGELHIEGNPVYWKDIKRMDNGRFSAVRVIPGIFSPWLHTVDLVIDNDGVMRQDDSHLPVIHRSLCQCVFTPKELKFKAAFDKAYCRD